MLLRDTIYQVIRRAIISCEFQPGQELREQILAERYHVSRSPIRDALLRLELDNLVTVTPRRGYQVKPVSVATVRDVFGLRLLIEPACAIAATQADGSALRMLDRFRTFSEQDDTEAGYPGYNRSFHNAIAELSGNPRMAGIARDLLEQVERLAQLARSPCGPDTVYRDCAEHAAIIDALQAHDADLASRLCYDHVKAAHERFRKSLEHVVSQ